MKDIPNWAKDLIRLADSVQFGTIQPQIVRKGGHVAEVVTTNFESIRYADTEKALTELARVVGQLTEAGFSGDLSLNIHFEKAEDNPDKSKIETIGYFSQKHTKYKDK